MYPPRDTRQRQDFRPQFQSGRKLNLNAARDFGFDTLPSFSFLQPLITLPNHAVQVLIGADTVSCCTLQKTNKQKSTANMSYQKPEKDFGEGPVRLLARSKVAFSMGED